MDAFGLHYLISLLLNFVHKGRGQHAVATIWRQTIPSKQRSSSFFLSYLGTVANTKKMFSKELTKNIPIFYDLKTIVKTIWVPKAIAS